jgi:hypothetical protein
MVEEELRPIPSKDWAAMIRKVYEVNLLTFVQWFATSDCVFPNPTA